MAARTKLRGQLFTKEDAYKYLTSLPRDGAWDLITEARQQAENRYDFINKIGGPMFAETVRGVLLKTQDSEVPELTAQHMMLALIVEALADLCFDRLLDTVTKDG